jgi:hypothetical protein
MDPFKGMTVQDFRRLEEEEKKRDESVCNAVFAV